MARLLAPDAEVVVPDLRGFGASAGAAGAAVAAFGAEGQARSVLGLIEELGLERPVIAGYDVGSRVAQAVARARPDAVRALVLAPPLPGASERVLTPEAQSEFWYQPFHRLPLAEQLLDGDERAVRAYLEHFWVALERAGLVTSAGPARPAPTLYARPGAFTASIAWYRAGSGTVAVSIAETPPAPENRIAVPTTVLWPEHDPLFPFAWSDRLDRFFSDVELYRLDGAGHFSPLEAPGAFAAAIRRRL